MDKSILFGLIGILATVIFGLLALFYVRKHKYPGKITFVKILSIGLLSDLIKNFKDISISYQNTPIKENLFLLKASIFNDGNMDIDDQMVKKPLSIVLYDGFKWMDLKLIDVSPNVQCSYSIKNYKKSLVWDLGLFRIGEYISFETLIEAPMSFKTSEDIINKIGFDSRIANCSVRKKAFPNKPTFIDVSYFIGILFLLPLIIFVYSLFNPFNFQKHKIHFKDSSEKVYKIHNYSKDKVTLLELDTNKKVHIDKLEFETSNKYMPSIPDKIDLKIFIPVMSILFIFLIFGLYFINRERKLYKLYTKGLNQKYYYTDLSD